MVEKWTVRLVASSIAYLFFREGCTLGFATSLGSILAALGLDEWFYDSVYMGMCEVLVRLNDVGLLFCLALVSYCLVRVAIAAFPMRSRKQRES